jgi:hypothetical protein
MMGLAGLRHCLVSPTSWPYGKTTRLRDLRLDPAPDDATNPGIAATAMAAINAIPAVIDAPPGLVHAPTGRSVDRHPPNPSLTWKDPKTVD